MFHDFLIDREERSAGFPALFALSAASRLALHSFELNLTSADAPIYHSPRWNDARLVVERSCGQRNRKPNSHF
jgi:hypothetical protein